MTTETAQDRQTLILEFKGSAPEYFRIWIANMALTILTFGIYSAWAKVRNRKYLYGNTYLAGSNFDYHADPMKILKGRIVVGILGAIYLFSGRISPGIGLLAGFFLALVFPWIIVKGMMFNLGQTSYRNLRFGFDPAFKEAYSTALKGGLISFFTLGLGFPYVMFLFQKFRINHARFGATHFNFNEDSSAPFFNAYFAAGLGYILGAVLLGIGGAFAKAHPVFTVVGAFGFFAALLASAAALKAKLAQATWNKSSLGGVQLKTTVTTSGYFSLYLVNAISLTLSLGLLFPWVTIRMLKYRVENTQVVASPEALQHFEQLSVPRAEGAIAESAADFWDFDIGF